MTRQILSLAMALSVGFGSGAAAFAADESELAPPVRLEADGAPIDMGALEGTYGHAGPWIADVDEDDDRDLIVGDFPGVIWWFENVGDDDEPEYAAARRMQAGPEAAKTPVY